MFLNRYLSLLKLAPSEENLTVLKSKGELQALVASATKAKPLFLMYYEPSCSHCYRGNRVFEQAAGHFNGFVRFARVSVRLPRRGRGGGGESKYGLLLCGPGEPCPTAGLQREQAAEIAVPVTQYHGGAHLLPSNGKSVPRLHGAHSVHQMQLY